jgi:hypothetical protein
MTFHPPCDVQGVGLAKRLAAPICVALMPTLSGVLKLRLDLDGLVVPAGCGNCDIDSIRWHELLRSFIGVNELRILRSALREHSRALQADNVGLDPGLLACRKSGSMGRGGQCNWFIHACSSTLR